MESAPVAPAPGAGQHPVFDRTAARSAVAASVGKRLIPTLLAEGIEALAAELQQQIALSIAHPLAAHQ